ncbi:hypothetical protein [Pedobacter sp. P26]|uniref:hypothetical protein n=1 Tax=Pedobacter sp. P26 TaxID=3423956 RepID=UPI003D676567
MASTLPFSSNLSNSVLDLSLTRRIIPVFSSMPITGLFTSEPGVTPTSIWVPPPPKKPKTRINIKGKASVNTTADGLRIIDRKLALARARVAVRLLYFFIYYLINSCAVLCS